VLGDFEGFLAKLNEYTQDEFGTNYMAAKNCHKLSSEDRRYLVLDAMECARAAGITIKHNNISPFSFLSESLSSRAFPRINFPLSFIFL